jgi:hypothetical protein
VPPRFASSEGHRERGTAAIELVAVVPLLLLAVLVAAQLGAVGGALWSAGIAARAGARAALVGNGVEPAARRALPVSLRVGTRVSEQGGGVAVRVPVPSLLPLPLRLTVGSESELGGE